MSEAIRNTGREGRGASGMAPACFPMPSEALGDPGLLSGRWRIDSREPLSLLESLLGDRSRDSRTVAFLGGFVSVRTFRLSGDSLGFSVRSDSASLCRARLWPDGEGTGLELTYRRGYGQRLVTVPEGVVLLEVLMGYVLPRVP